MGRPVGEQLEHAALAVVLFQAAVELTAFIFLWLIWIARVTYFCSQAFDFNKPGLKAPPWLLLNASFLWMFWLMCFGVLFDLGHICVTTIKFMYFYSGFRSFKPQICFNVLGLFPLFLAIPSYEMYKEHRSFKAKLSWNSLISPTEAQFDLRTFGRNYKSKDCICQLSSS